MFPMGGRVQKLQEQLSVMSMNVRMLVDGICYQIEVALADDSG